MELEGKREILAIFTLGTTPMVVTEFLQKFSDGGEIKNCRIKEILIIYTSDSAVEKSYKILRTVLKAENPEIRIEGVKLPYSDVTSTENAIDFIYCVGKSLRRYEGKRKLFCIAGGRKNMSVMLTIVAQYYGGEVYHVIYPGINVTNIDYEQIKKEIEEIISAESPEEEYMKRRDKIRPIFFPPPNNVSLVKLPVIPFPPEVLAKLLAAYVNRRSIVKEFDDEYLKKLAEAGIIVKDRGADWTKFGSEVLEAILGRRDAECRRFLLPS